MLSYIKEAKAKLRDVKKENEEERARKVERKRLEEKTVEWGEQEGRKNKEELMRLKVREEFLDR